MRKTKKAQAQALNLFLSMLILIFLIVIYFVASFFVTGKNKSIVIGKEIKKTDESYDLLKSVLFSKENNTFVYEYIYLYLNGNKNALDKFKLAFNVLDKVGYNYALTVYLKTITNENLEKVFEINKVKNANTELILPYLKSKVIVIKFELK